MLIDAIDTSEPLQLSTEFIAMTLVHAETVADAAARSLQEMGIDNKSAQGLQMSVILEIGALAQLRSWKSIFKEDYPVELPSFNDAQQDLLQRLKETPNDFNELSSATLSLHLFKFQMNNLAWSNPCSWLTPFVIADEDSFINDLAEVLWDTRHDFIS